MKRENRTHKAATITEMIFEIFRLHGRLIAFGDRMVEGLGLTSARWQVLGSIALAEAAPTIPNIARNLGLSRQAVQRVANDLAAEGFIRTIDNPHHKRAKLVGLTEKGRRVYRRADRTYNGWVDAVAGNFKNTELQIALEAMRSLDDRCKAYLEQSKKTPGR